MSFIHIDDLINIIFYLLNNQLKDSLYNATTPFPTTNKVFTRTLAQKLKRPSFLVIPNFILKWIYGEGSDVLISGQYVTPKALLENNYTFKYETIDKALEAIIYNKS